MYIALRLLRDGAHTTIRDAVPEGCSTLRRARRQRRLDPPAQDRRDRPARPDQQVVSLADEVAAAGPLDILINNAAQTVRRSPGAYSQLVELESAPCPTTRPSRRSSPSTGSATRTRRPLPARCSGTRSRTTRAPFGTVAARPLGNRRNRGGPLGGGDDRARPLRRQREPREHLGRDRGRRGGLLPDLQTENSWTQKVEEVDPLELLEVQLYNATAPFILISRLRPAMRAAVQAGARRAYVVNVSAMEGQILITYKGPGHPHTNMAKASLNMRARTSAGEMFETDAILMTAVDTAGSPTSDRTGEAADRRRGLARPAPTWSTARRGSTTDRARRDRRGPVRLLREGLPPQPLVTRRAPRHAPVRHANLSAAGPDVRGLPEVLVSVVHYADQPDPQRHRRVPPPVDDPVEVLGVTLAR